MSVAGKPMVHGIGGNARLVVECALLAGAARFKAFAAIDSDALKQPCGATVRFLVFAVQPAGDADAAGLTIPVNLEELGLGLCAVKDLWSGETFRGPVKEPGPFVPWHGAALFRVSPVKKPESKRRPPPAR